MDNKLFKTRDFYQAVVLMTSELDLLSLEKSSEKFVTFCFSDPKSLASKIIEQYWSDELRINPKDLIRNIKELKNRLYTNKAMEN
jgi:hypothetical protein